MDLKELLAPWDKYIKPGCMIRGLQNDSRLVAPGDLFLAYPEALWMDVFFSKKQGTRGLKQLSMRKKIYRRERASLRPYRRLPFHNWKSY